MVERVTGAEREEMREWYREQRNEARMMGQEFPSFEEWMGEKSLKEEKAAEWQQRYDNDTQDLY